MQMHKLHFSVYILYISSMKSTMTFCFVNGNITHFSVILGCICHCRKRGGLNDKISSFQFFEFEISLQQAINNVSIPMSR